MCVWVEELGWRVSVPEFKDKYLKGRNLLGLGQSECSHIDPGQTESPPAVM